jgi:hypothetical protein
MAYHAAMRALSLALLGMIVGCAEAPPPPPAHGTTTTPPPPASTSDGATTTNTTNTNTTNATNTTNGSAHADATNKWRTRPADAACQSAITALASGALDTFRGIEKCGRVDAEFAIGSSGDQPSKFEKFGEYRVYPHVGGSILVWFLADDIRVMQLLYPKLKRPIKSLLGEPEAKVKSQLSDEWEQWVYASRGLTAHVKRGTGEVITLFAYRPTTVEAFLQTDIAKVAKSEDAVEELK